MVKESDSRIPIFVKSDRDYMTSLKFNAQYAIIYDVSDCAAVARGLRLQPFFSGQTPPIQRISSALFPDPDMVPGKRKIIKYYI